jgi:hypothetical protein
MSKCEEDESTDCEDVTMLDSVLLIGKGQWHLTCFVYGLQEINSITFLFQQACLLRELS